MNEFANANEPENRIRIAERVLMLTGRNDMFKPQDVRGIRVDYAPLTQNDVQDVLVTLDMGPEATIMAVFTPAEDGYEYVGEVGYFFTVDNIDFYRPDEDKVDVIIFRESNNQSIGGLENSSFLRGYIYKDGKFVNVINIDENIESWWNDELTGIAQPPVKNPQWNKITQTSVIRNNADYTVIDATKTQTYSIAPPTANKIKPKDTAFTEQTIRVINEVFTWSNEWQSYIVDEKIEGSTGEKVAVLKDFGAFPYILTGDTLNEYRVLRKNGSVDILKYEEVDNVTE